MIEDDIKLAEKILLTMLTNPACGEHALSSLVNVSFATAIQFNHQANELRDEACFNNELDVLPEDHNQTEIL